MGIDLNAIDTLYVHDDCADGLFSALIIQDAARRIGKPLEIRFVQYDTSQHTNLTPRPGVMFCDFTPHAEREEKAPNRLTKRGVEDIRRWVEVGAVVLDHHAGAKDIMDLFNSFCAQGIYSDKPGVSGAVLAYEHVWLPVAKAKGVPISLQTQLEGVARLLGIRDTFQREAITWEYACQLTATTMFWSRNVLLDLPLEEALDLIDRPEIGSAILEKQFLNTQRACDEAFKFSIFLGGDAHRIFNIACFEGNRQQASDVADMLRGKADVVMAWHYFNVGGVHRMKVSVRSCDPKVNCAAFAKILRGNGHPGAAGFTIEPGNNSPYSIICELTTRAAKAFYGDNNDEVKP